MRNNSQALRILVWTAVSTRVQSKKDRYSLPIQEQEGRQFADDNQGVVIEVLRVPGHTRRLLDWEELKRRALRKDIDAFIRLEEHWKAKDFDVLWCRGGDRFARSQSIFARVTEEVIFGGARIFAEQDGGWVDKRNFRDWISLAGRSAAGSVDKLVELGRDTKDEKAAVGLGINSRPIWSHRIVRNHLGRMEAVEPDESRRLVIEDAARLVVEGVAWRDIEPTLAERFGHMNSGKPFGGLFFYNLFHNPYFWGNNARRWKAHTGNGGAWDTWVFSPSTPAPTGVLIYYDTHPPYLKSDLADGLMAELMRRRSAIRGNARPYHSKWFSGLLLCGECFYFMGWTDNGGGIHYYRCTPASSGQRTKRPCSGQFVREDAIQHYFEKALRAMIAEKDPYYFFRDTDPGESAAAMRARLEEVRASARTLIGKQTVADTAIAGLYDEPLEALAREMRTLEARLSEAERDHDRDERAAARRAYGELVALPDPAVIWAWESMRVNQFFHQLMGRHRLLLVEKKVERIVRR